MRKKVTILTAILLGLYISGFGQEIQPRDGRLLQGESWQPFVPTETADFYVSVKGNDSWSGTLPEPNSTKSDGPFATLKRAQQAVRELKSKVYQPKDAPIETRWIGSPHPFGRGKDILVYIREGFYSLSEPLVFEPIDGGERVETNLPTGAFEYHKLKDHYVTYAAFPGEKPVISGGVEVSGWKKNGEIWTADFDADSVKMLVVNGKSQTLARTPNTGYFIPPAISKSTSELYFNKGEIKNWGNMEDNRVVMLLRWHTGINSITNVNEKNGVATFKAPQPGVVIVPPRYYIENVKALLDAPGEWFFDKDKKELSYIPEIGLDDPNQVTAEVPAISNLITIKGERGHPVRNLRLYGLTFEGTAPGNSVINIEYAHACELAQSTLQSSGGTGIYVHKGCYQTRIFENHFESIDDKAIYVLGSKNPPDGRDIIRETLITKNQIYDCAGNNIMAQFTLMTTISHNYITKTRGRYAIDVGGWSNQEEAVDGGYLVEYNHLDDVQAYADDSGVIVTAGMTFNSVVRRNLIHDVRAGFFNDNVGFWFDNMSQGWVSEENIFYNLEQGEWKLCASMIEDNVYRNNFKIDAPATPPEIIIEGSPVFSESNLNLTASSRTASGAVVAGSVIKVSADVYNSGSSGIHPVLFYVDGKIHEQKPFPVIKNNTGKIEFEVRLYEEGEHRLAIGSTPYQTIHIEGEKPSVVFEDFTLSGNRVLNGETVQGTAKASNLTSTAQKLDAVVFVNAEKVQSHPVELKAGESKMVNFELKVPVGKHQVRIENSAVNDLTVFEGKVLDISKMKIDEYCSAKAKPYKIEADQKRNRFKITAGGSDFLHAEDSYASAYLKGIKGDFVATVTIRQFGDRTHEWFRSGLFVRN
ncbi:MAG TPA: right-handed parallel beta-helix repeat-containing protein, partial [Dysgonamonadaceae bacterium]|nr:right-handed parallel beta-helix repeat-containing protein [Dysgonamonadaceae bacterium]